MLPPHLRLRRSGDFGPVIKQGYRVVRPTLVMYARPAAGTRVGLVVGRAIGGAVQRNWVKRQLRHGAAALIDAAAPMDVVVRALPGAASAGAGLRADLSTAWGAAREAVHA